VCFHIFAKRFPAFAWIGTPISSPPCTVRLQAAGMTPEQLVLLWKAVGLVNALNHLSPPSWPGSRLTRTTPADALTDLERVTLITIGAFILSTVLMVPRNVSKEVAITVFKATLPTMSILSVVTMFIYPSVQSTIGKINTIGCLVLNLGVLAYLLH